MGKQETNTEQLITKIANRLRKEGERLCFSHGSTFGDRVAGAALLHAYREITAALNEDSGE